MQSLCFDDWSTNLFCQLRVSSIEDFHEQWTHMELFWAIINTIRVEVELCCVKLIDLRGVLSECFHQEKKLQRTDFKVPLWLPFALC